MRSELPVVVIVGRPNVGKSSLFNRIVGRRVAVVDDVPGVTRDRLYAPSEWHGREFQIVDTGGLVPSPDDPMIDQVRFQVDVAMREAAVVWFLVDLITGLTPDDRAIAERLHATGKNVLVVANKADHPGLEMNIGELYELGFEEVVPVSAIHRHGIGDLLDRTIAQIPEGATLPEAAHPPMRIAVVGRPNAGKSSIINALLGENRVIVDERPGTTRDAINVRFDWQGTTFELVDTAGMRRRSRVEKRGVEEHSVLRATRSVRQSDITWLVLDMSRELAHQDRTIAGFVARHGKLCILVANKWDLIEKSNETFGEYTARIQHEFRAWDYLPIVFTSAVTAQRIETLLELSQRLYTAASTRVPTPALNEFFRRATMEHPPPSTKGRRPSMKYIAQVDVLPPTFVVFTTLPDEIPSGYVRFLAHAFREAFDFEGVPIRFRFRDARGGGSASQRP